MKKLLCIIMCAMLLFTAAACDKENTSGGDGESHTSYSVVEGFDSYKTIDRIWFANSLASAELCKEEGLVSTGEGSLKIAVSDPDRFEGEQHSTSFYVPTTGNAVGDFRDFSMIDQITLDVYGVEGENLTVGIMPVKKGASVVSGPSATFDVKKGEWTTVSYTINRTAIAAAMDITTITHISLSAAGVDAVICIDNLRIHHAVGDYVPIEIELDENEICDFEKPYQSFAYNALMSGGVLMRTEINTDPLYASSGARSLKVYSPIMEVDTWIKIELSTRVLKAREITMYPSDWYIAYDVYKPWQKSMNLTTVLRCSASNAYNNVSTSIPAGIGWHTVCISMNNVVRNMDTIQLSWKSRSSVIGKGDEETVFYVDNFRMIQSLPTSGSLKVVN